MTTRIFDLDQITGNEALTVGEHIVALYKEFSLGIDKFNAKHFNKSIHTVKTDPSVWLKGNKTYFDVSFKHIQSPVFFNPAQMSFKEYTILLLQSIGAMKLVMTQAEDLYRALKNTAVTGKVPFNIRNGDHLVMISELREKVEQLKESKVFTRPVSELYPNWSEVGEVIKYFNKEVSTLKSRDTEVLAKQADQVVEIVKLVKRKVDQNEIILSPSDFALLNESVKFLSDNLTFIGYTFTLLSETTRVLNIQVDELVKL